MLRAVMRACEGCRRRKIKCDAATTNTWPCSACIRLKLHCVPPTVNYDRDFQNGSQGFQPDSAEYSNGNGGDDDYHHQVSLQQQLTGPQKPNTAVYPQLPYGEPVGVYQQSMPYSAGQSSNHGLNYGSMQPPINVLDGNYQQPQHSFPTPPIQHQPQPQTPDNYQQDQYAEEDLSDLLGGLKMNEAGTGKLYHNSLCKTQLTEVEHLS